MADEETTTAAPATNGPDNDLCLFHLGAIMRSAEEKNSSDGAHRSNFSRAITAGMDEKAIKAALKIRKSKDPRAAIATIQQTIRYCQILGIDQFAQMELELPSAGEPVRTPLEDAAREDGHRVGMMGGEVTECPHPRGSPGYNDWHTAYSLAIKEYRRKLAAVSKAEEEQGGEILKDVGTKKAKGKDTPVDDPLNPPKKRGRPPKNAKANGEAKGDAVPVPTPPDASGGVPQPPEPPPTPAA